MKLHNKEVKCGLCGSILEVKQEDQVGKSLLNARCIRCGYAGIVADIVTGKKEASQIIEINKMVCMDANAAKNTLVKISRYYIYTQYSVDYQRKLEEDPKLVDFLDHGIMKKMNEWKNSLSTDDVMELEQLIIGIAGDPREGWLNGKEEKREESKQP